MVQTALQTYEQLKERITGQKLSRGTYVEKNEDGSCNYCSVGHLMVMAGLDMDNIQEFYNSIDIDTVPEDILIDIESSLSLEQDEMFSLQLLNDNTPEEQRTAKVLAWIDEKIEVAKDYSMEGEE